MVILIIWKYQLVTMSTRHFEICSGCLFTSSSLSWILSFSWMDSKLLIEIFEYPETLFTIDHFKIGIHLYSHTHFKRVVSLAYFQLQNLLYYCFLKPFFAVPRYMLCLDQQWLSKCIIWHHLFGCCHIVSNLFHSFNYIVLLMLKKSKSTM